MKQVIYFVTLFVLVLSGQVRAEEPEQDVKDFQVFSDEMLQQFKAAGDTFQHYLNSEKVQQQINDYFNSDEWKKWEKNAVGMAQNLASLGKDLSVLTDDLPDVTAYKDLSDAVSETDKKGGQTRTVHKTFDVKANSQLYMEHKYGNITIVGWNEQRIEMTATIWVKASSEARMTERMNTIDVSMSQNGNVVKAVTSIGKMKNTGGNMNMSIDYVVKVPADVLMNLKCKFGDIYVRTDVMKVFNTEIEYGDLYTQRLGDAQLHVAFGDFDIAQAGNLVLNMKYGDGKIGDIASLDVKSEFSSFDMGKVGTLNGTSRYDKYALSGVNVCRFGNFAFSDLTVGELISELLIGDCNYANIKVKKLSDEFKTISILDADFSTVDLDLSIQHAVLADINLKYGSLTSHHIAIPKLADNGVLQATIGAGRNTASKVIIQGIYTNVNL